MQKDGSFLNYVDFNKKFTNQNYTTNLADSNGRAIWALGYLLSIYKKLPISFQEQINDVDLVLEKALKNSESIHSSRAMAFIIKGLYYRQQYQNNTQNIRLMHRFSARLVQMYLHEKDNDWHWFESYLTYANSILPEALLCAFISTGNQVYKEIAMESFDFLCSKIFKNKKIKVISNKGWLLKNENSSDESAIITGGEQPIDVAYTIITLSKFYKELKSIKYLIHAKEAFNWFLGSNHLNQIIYNPCTGGCYDGLEEHNVNLNQGAESTVSYLMARQTLETILNFNQKSHNAIDELVNKNMANVM